MLNEVRTIRLCFKDLNSNLNLHNLILLCSVRRQLSQDVTAKQVTALLLSCLDHCNAVLAGLPPTTLDPPQRVLHAAASTVLHLNLGDHVTPALRKLHWLPITERVQYNLYLLVHKVFVRHAPDYIARLLTPARDIHSRSSLRSSSNCDLVVPRTSWKIGDKAFSVTTPRAWNWLPTGLSPVWVPGTVVIE